MCAVATDRERPRLENGPYLWGHFLFSFSKKWGVQHRFGGERSATTPTAISLREDQLAPLERGPNCRGGHHVAD
jgi:hypothetical protein